ncbi:MAG: outer membrane beta-barrel protein [Endomicrobiaceae bacterium]|nr:outer membrane beta-barrel protein [Endomicrobiaceae bacterium]
MKKSLLALLFAVALAVPALAENMWVGGDLSYSATNSKVVWNGTDRNKQSQTSWSIEPEFGYSLNEKWDIGVDLAYASKQGVTEIYGVVVPEGGAVDTTEFGIAPFARFHVAQIAGVDVMFKGSVFYASGEAKDLVDYSAYGIAIVPVISYSINETWSIGATLNFAELSYTHADAKVKDAPFSIEPKADEFGFNLNDGSLISIGFSYHF